VGDLPDNHHRLIIVEIKQDAVTCVSIPFPSGGLPAVGSVFVYSAVVVDTPEDTVYFSWEGTVIKSGLFYKSELKAGKNAFRDHHHDFIIISQCDPGPLPPDLARRMLDADRLEDIIRSFRNSDVNPEMASV
jgi:hypothetical protein